MRRYTKHIFQEELGDYRKKFEKAMDSMFPLMPTESNLSDFYTMFLKCFQDLVEEYESFSKYYTRKETELLHFERKSRYRLPKWQLFIDDYLASSDTNGCFKVGLLSQNEQEKKLQKLVSDCKERVLTRETKKQYKNRLVQYTCPRYVQKLIGMYLRHRRTHSGDEDYRYHIVSEIAKYKHHETIQLLHQINNTEPVFPIRHIAFLALQQFGEYVKLRKVKKKLKEDPIKIPIEMIKNPDSMLEKMAISQIESMKHFNVFISHCYRDESFLIDLTHDLNRKGLNVYMDWMEDRDALPRVESNEKTAEVIKRRIKASDIVLCVVTDQSINSEWVPWEMGYADGIGKEILVLDMLKRENPANVYIDLYPKVDREQVADKAEEMVASVKKKTFYKK